MKMPRHRLSPRIGQAIVAAVLLGCSPAALAQAPPVWGELALPGGSSRARDVMALGDPDRRLESMVLVDFVRRYANTDLRTAADRLEHHLRTIETSTPTIEQRADDVSVLPLPLPDLWAQAFSDEGTPLLVAMLRSRPALLTYHGLMALDTPTLTRLSARPALLHGFLSNRTASAAFAAFGQSLRVGDDGVMTPGGDESRVVWHHLVGFDPANVDAFVPALYQRDAGRLAWFYDTVSGLPEATQHFVLATDLPADARRAAVEAIYRHFASVDRSWSIGTRPFHRPAFDGAMVLLALDTVDGRVGADWWPAMFDAATRQADWSAPRSAATPGPDRQADAQWLFEWIFGAPDQAQRRFSVIRFAQRLLASVPREAAPHMPAALGGVLEMPLLMMSLERMGVRDPETFAIVARAARAATHTGSRGSVLPPLGRWQAALGLIEQIQRRAALPETSLDPLVRALAAIAPIENDASDGSVAAWLHDHLLPELGVEGVAGAGLEDAFLRAATTPRTGSLPTFNWEGLPYVIDGPTVALTSATAIRRSRVGPQLQDLVELHRLRQAIVAGSSPTPATARQLVIRLERLAPVISTIDHRDDRRLAGFARVIQSVGGTTGDRLSEDLPQITAALDAVTDAVVPSLLYALAVSPTFEPILYPDAWARHSLEQPVALPAAASRPWRDVAWQLPTDYGFGGGTRLVGAYLGVDVALADSQLVRVLSGALPVPGVVDEPMRRGLVESIVLAGRTGDVVPSSRLTHLAAGRQLVDMWTREPPGEAVSTASLRGASVDGWRANAIAWELMRSRSGALRSLTMTEIAWLGTPAGQREEAPEWSGSSRLLDGCLCRLQARRVTHEQMRGRRLGVQALRPHDITLRLTELVASMDLDTRLVPALLPMALQDWLDRSRPAWSDDWEAFTTWPHQLTVDRVEEYLLHLVATGVFSAPATEESSR